MQTKHIEIRGHHLNLIERHYLARPWLFIPIVGYAIDLCDDLMFVSGIKTYGYASFNAQRKLIRTIMFKPNTKVTLTNDLDDICKSCKAYPNEFAGCDSKSGEVLEVGLYGLEIGKEYTAGEIMTALRDFYKENHV